jgi:hypothetical protein
MLEGGHISAERANVVLDGVSTGARLRISGASGSNDLPTILSLQDSDVGAMSFAHCDMSRCVFYGSNDIADAIVEPTVSFSLTPKFWRTKRRCIADEFAWRRTASALNAWGWSLPTNALVADNQQKPGLRDDVQLPRLRASQVAAVYRDLRSSFEARSDRPGAADFYYGEMEMRRHSENSSVAERLIVTVYWLVSGYGLRAWRSFAWLAGLLFAGGSALSHWGFPDGPLPFRDGVVFAVRAMIPSLHRNIELTRIGSLVEIVLTLFGPVLVALALLALRGRVRR